MIDITGEPSANNNHDLVNFKELLRSANEPLVNAIEQQNILMVLITKINEEQRRPTFWEMNEITDRMREVVKGTMSCNRILQDNMIPTGRK